MQGRKIDNVVNWFKKGDVKDEVAAARYIIQEFDKLRAIIEGETDGR
jgi:hypothetical protein